jgi:hypothetical protein
MGRFYTYGSNPQRMYEFVSLLLVDRNLPFISFRGTHVLRPRWPTPRRLQVLPPRMCGSRARWHSTRMGGSRVGKRGKLRWCNVRNEPRLLMKPDVALIPSWSGIGHEFGSFAPLLTRFSPPDARLGTRKTRPLNTSTNKPAPCSCRTHPTPRSTNSR